MSDYIYHFDNDLATLVTIDLRSGLVPMLIGEPGIGKSSWVRELASRLHARYFCLACNQLAAKEDMTGARLVPVTLADGTTDYEQRFWPHTVVKQAMRAAAEHPDERVLLFMDEINRTTPDVTSELLSIPTMRSIGDQELPDNIMVIVAGNDKGNVTTLDEASVSRFVNYHVAPDVDTYLSLTDDLNPFIVQVLQKHPETIFCKRIEDAPSENVDEETGDTLIDALADLDTGTAQFTTPRTISGLSKKLNSFDNTDLLRLLSTSQQTPDGQMSHLQGIIESHVGHTAFSVRLLEAIAAGLSTVQNRRNAQVLIKPEGFDDLLAVSTRDDLARRVDAMSAPERSHMLLWALADSRDCEHVISAIAPTLGHLEGDDANQLMRAFLRDELDKRNLATFVDGGSDLGLNYGRTLGIQ